MRRAFSVIRWPAKRIAARLFLHEKPQEHPLDRVNQYRKCSSRSTIQASPRLAVIWIDWYPYHVARLRGLLSAPELVGSVVGIELVGGTGVHAGLRFREQLPADLPIHTILPAANWAQAGQMQLAIRLWRYLSRLQPQSVLVPGYYTLPGLAAALWARLHRRPSILMTESTAHDHLRSGWKERTKAALLRVFFDAAVAGGKAHVRYLVQLGFPQDRIGRCYDVVDNNAYASRTEHLRRSHPAEHALPESPYFLYVGRIAPEKNTLGLVQAWLNYRRAGGAWPLVIVGDGPSMPELRRLVSTSGHHQDVHLAGHKSSHELPMYYAFAGCFVLPSLREPWGLVVNEAMASALPVIVSTACGSAEDLVRDGINGFTFSPRGCELEARLNQMCALSESQRTTMGARSRAIVSAYSPQQFGLEVQSLLNAAGA